MEDPGTAYSELVADIGPANALRVSLAINKCIEKARKTGHIILIDCGYERINQWKTEKEFFIRAQVKNWSRQNVEVAVGFEMADKRPNLFTTIEHGINNNWDGTLRTPNVAPQGLVIHKARQLGVSTTTYRPVGETFWRIPTTTDKIQNLIDEIWKTNTQT